MSEPAVQTKPGPVKAAPSPRMPYIEVGMTVLWFPGGDRRNGHAAIVTGIGFDSLNLNVLLPQSYNMAIRDGVRHADDHRAKSNEVTEAGTWDHTPLMKHVLAFLDVEI